MPIQTMEGPSSSVQLKGSQSGGCGSFTTTWAWRTTGLGRITGILNVTTPTGTPGVEQTDNDGNSYVTDLVQNADGAWPIDIPITMPYVILHPAGVGESYDACSFFCQLLPMGGAGGSGGGGGGGAGGTIQTATYTSTQTQNGQQAATISNTDASSIRIKRVVLNAAAADLFDWLVTFHDAALGNVIDQVLLPASSAQLRSGFPTWAADVDIPYVNAAKTLNIYTSLMPLSGAKTATATVDVTYTTS